MKSISFLFIILFSLPSLAHYPDWQQELAIQKVRRAYKELKANVLTLDEEIQSYRRGLKNCKKENEEYLAEANIENFEEVLKISDKEIAQLDALQTSVFLSWAPFQLSKSQAWIGKGIQRMNDSFVEIVDAYEYGNTTNNNFIELKSNNEVMEKHLERLMNNLVESN